ncbi:MAG: hypothetical protein APF80_01745 [Alphaproteobacteria bacterium BRH_c36]|nr:MAG: hypothetical protein APF80_01745 [Alphaproteobacteria bacterium BRH_c36]
MAVAGKADDVKKAGLGGALLPFLVLAILGAGFGIGFKLYFLSPATSETKAAVANAEPAQHAGKPDGHPEAAHGEKSNLGAHGEEVNSGQHGAAAGEPFIVSIDPVVTTLAQGPPSWIRLEVSLIFKRQPEENMKTVAAEVSNDFVAYLRTVNAAQIEGAQGLEYLTDDLTDIVRVRTHGAADRLVIKGLVVE